MTSKISVAFFVSGFTQTYIINSEGELGRGNAPVVAPHPGGVDTGALPLQLLKSNAVD